jgi:hypothetical protein
MEKIIGPIINKKNLRLNISLILMILLYTILCCSCRLVYSTNMKNSESADLVPDSKTAIKISVSLCKIVFGRGCTKHAKPFNAVLKDDGIWYVSGTLREKRGGTLKVNIQKKDCKVIAIYFMK